MAISPHDSGRGCSLLTACDIRPFTGPSPMSLQISRGAQRKEDAEEEVEPAY